MKPFDVVAANSPDNLVHIIKISGELRRGTYLDSNDSWSSYINNAKNIAKTQVVVFDLQNLVYWDTKGISEVIETVKNINTAIAKKRAGIIAPSDPQMYVVAKVKYPSIGNDLIPWKPSKEELLNFLGG